MVFGFTALDLFVAFDEVAHDRAWFLGFAGPNSLATIGDRAQWTINHGGSAGADAGEIDDFL